jgi:hypothetical protein
MYINLECLREDANKNVWAIKREWKYCITTNFLICTPCQYSLGEQTKDDEMGSVYSSRRIDEKVMLNYGLKL